MNIQANSKKFGILMISLGVVFIFIIVYFVFFHDFSTPSEAIPFDPEIMSVGQELPNNVVGESFGLENIVRDTPQLTSRELSQEGIKQIAASFAERYGTFSNQNNASNLIDLKLMMTSSMNVWVDERINEVQMETADYQEYIGITTKAVTTEVLDYTEVSMEVVVGTQRHEIKAGQVRDFNQDLLLTMKKVGKVWLVDSAYWQ